MKCASVIATAAASVLFACAARSGAALIQPRPTSGPASPSPEPATTRAAVPSYTAPDAESLARLTAAGAPDDATVAAILAQLDADPLLREAAVRRLTPHADVAARRAVDAFATANLPSRLGILDLLHAWDAPTDGLDPWTPASVTPQRIEALRGWAASAHFAAEAKSVTTRTTRTTRAAPATAAAPTTTAATTTTAAPTATAAATMTRVAPTTTRADIAGRPASLSDESLAAARSDVRRLLAAGSTADERVIRERLSRLGEPLLPEVYATLKDAPTDDARRRLRALRYRIVASDALALAWMDGLERLASPDAPARIAALDELSQRATPADQRLLLELFADPDALFRERSLKLLQSVGGARATAAMATLLRDPEPNVRAAVLKQLAETPSHEMVGAVVAYLRIEADSDLVVHAVRVLRAAKGDDQALAALKALLGHASWRVRAEAVEAVDDLADDMQPAEKTATYGALIRVLDDADGFVIARAVTALGKASLAAAVEPMARAAQKHPQLAGEVVAAMTRNTSLGPAALPHLREFAKHSSPGVRAAAVTGLCEIDPHAAAGEITAALKDPEVDVRVAAAKGILDALDESRPPASTETTFLGMRRTVRTDMSQWLANFRAGLKDRPDWVANVLPPLEPMLKAASPKERAAAASVLVAVGQDAPAYDILEAAAQDDADARLVASQALGWLPWEKRLALFDRIVRARTGDEELGRAISAMSRSGDARAAGPLWDLLKPPDASVKLLHQVVDGLRYVYLGDRYYDVSNLSEADRKPVIDACVGRAASGSEMQKSAALALLLTVSLTDAAAQGARLVDDPASGEWLRLDALQARLVAATRDEGDALARKYLADPVLVKVALPYLAMGPRALQQFRGEIHLYYNNPQAEPGASFGNGQPVIIERPQNLPTEALTTLLHGSDPKMAAYAAYVLALGGDRRAFDLLRDYWQQSAKDDDDWQRLVYRAASAVNDDALTPTLEAIYRSMGPTDWQVREFYWTISNLKGERALRLHETIRDEAGMDRLR